MIHNVQQAEERGQELGHEFLVGDSVRLRQVFINLRHCVGQVGYTDTPRNKENPLT